MRTCNAAPFPWTPLQLLIKEFKGTRVTLDKSRKVNKRLLLAYDKLQRKCKEIRSATEGMKNGTLEPHQLPPLSPSESMSFELKEAIEVGAF